MLKSSLYFRIAPPNIDAKEGREWTPLHVAIAKEHQVFMIGGTALGSHIIPLVENHGIPRENIYSGYFNGFEEDEMMKALLRDFRYINAHNPHYATPISEKKSEPIKLLRSQGKIKNKVIHIGDGTNDLEAWQNDAVDHFIGFGVIVVPQVKEHAPIFVESLDGFKQELSQVLYTNPISHSYHLVNRS